MNAQTEWLRRSLGACLAVSGVLFLVGGPFHPDDSVPGGILAASWIPVHVAMTAAYGLMGIGVLSAALSDRAGRLEGSLVLLAMIAAIPTVGLTFFEAVAAPPLVRALPEVPSLMALVAPGTPFPALQPAVGVTIVLGITSNIAYWVALWRTGHRRDTLALIASMVLEVLPLPGMGHGLAIAVHGAVLASIGRRELRR